MRKRRFYGRELSQVMQVAPSEARCVLTTPKARLGVESRRLATRTDSLHPRRKVLARPFSSEFYYSRLGLDCSHTECPFRSAGL